MEHDYFKSFQWELSWSNITSEQVVLISSKHSLILVLGLWAHFLTNGALCTNGKRDFGTKFSGPDFLIPFAQTVNQLVCPCNWQMTFDKISLACQHDQHQS